MIENLYFIVRKWKIVMALLRLKQHNAVYSNVKISQDFIDLLPDDEIPDEIKKSFHHCGSDDTNNTKTSYDNINRDVIFNYCIDLTVSVELRIIEFNR